MPGRGGRIGGGSRGGGFRAPRVSSGGSRGARIGFGSRASRAVSSTPSANASSTPPHHVYHRPWYRRGISTTSGGGWNFIGILIGLIVLGICACVAVAIAVQYFGLGL